MKKIILSILTILFVAPALRASNIGVPAECEDVMLQCFYWDSYTLTKYNRTKWIDLLKDTADINASFDLVWFPPSAQSTGGVGYYHTCLSNQSGTAWGTLPRLQELIAALHAGNTKVLADIVINHRGSVNGWCIFAEDKFGEGYGSFQLTTEHICKYDEAFTNSDSNCYGGSERGAEDTGTNDGGCRDIDHTSEYVQEWAKTYTRWMLDSMKYDGFRYDMTLGYHGRYLSMYNEASQPYFSVSELWEGIDRQKQHLEETNYNTMVFDFQQKYELHKAIVGGNYSKLVKNSNSFRGQGLERYAVTFIDNHDTFEREDNKSQEFYKYNADLSLATTKAFIMQANAYILMMPGVPCVFWPHWYSYKQEIKDLIAIRKIAGIHSESEVLDETSGTKAYSATIQGHRRKVILRLGQNRDMTIPAGYWRCINADYYTVYLESPEGIDEVGGEEIKTGNKFLKDGQLYIRYGEKVYDVRGKAIQ